MKLRVLLAAASLLTISACSGGQGGPGADGRSVVLRTASEPPGANCASGGLKVQSGIDANGNASLDDAEIASTAYVCDGAGGQGVVAAAENPGTNCTHGGVRLTPEGGLPTYVCHGAPGADGQSVAVTPEPVGSNCALGGQQVAVGGGTPNYVCNGAAGADGQSVAVTPEPAGSTCTYGGQRLAVGSASPTFVCNGAPGADGQGVSVTPEPVGSNCEHGGQRLAVGGGTPTYVCHGAPGANGADGQSVTVTPEPAGAHCAYGGQQLTVGSASPTFVCNGAPGADGESVAVTPESPGGNCAAGGVSLRVGSGPPSYLCNGAAGAAGESVTMAPEPPGANCLFGGVSLRVGTGPVEYLCSGTPAGITRPTVQTAPVTEVRYVEAAVDATVTDDGGEFVLVRGVTLATHAAPTLHDTVYLAGLGVGGFATTCDGLTPATTYFVRAFATNTVGTTYGEERSFTTRALTVPALTTHAISNLTTTTALSGGTITDDGGTPILGRGICWSPSPDPGLGGLCDPEGIGAGSFLALAAGLSSNTTYHLRAYATNAQGTSYGVDLSFTTIVLPLATVTTAAPSAAYTTATGGGNVASDNGSPVTSRGVCWSTSPAPTTANATYTEPGGTGPFTATLTGLATSTIYYVRAFAVNGGGTSYGNQVTFTTLAPALPALTTKAVTGISNYLAGSGGVISADGGSAITAKGVCWSLNPTPTIGNSRTNEGAGTATFNSTMTGLIALTAYHVRAYATNGVGTAYGNELSFTTTDVVVGGPFVPVVGTTPVTMGGGSTASGGGYVSNDGGSPVTARGLCWSTAQNPDTSSSCSADGGTGEGFFTSTVTGLSGCNVTYYVRAYATNTTGTGYGSQVTVATGLAASPTTDPATAIGYYTATSGGSIVDNGGCAVTARGVAYGLSPNPTTAGQKTIDGTGFGSFVSTLTGLYANRTYYARAYATNAAGTAYGPQVVFATLEPSTPYVGGNFGGGRVIYVDGSGLHGIIAATVDQGNAAWGCSGTSLPTGTAIGTGAANTATIVAACADAGTAAKVADTLVLNGYDDWFLPSRDELTLAWTTLEALGIGGFAAYNYYLTSSQYDASYAWFVYAPGTSSWITKTSSNRVRAMRAF